MNVGTFNPGEPKPLSCLVHVTQNPSGGTITNEVSQTYTYQPPPTLQPVTPTAPTPPTSVKVNTAPVKPTTFADRAFSDICDIMTYTITLHNNGTVPATNVIFTDSSPAGTTFIPNSVVLNNNPVPNSNTALGITVVTLNPGETKTLSFQVRVTQIHAGGTIKNEASTTYPYETDPTLPPVTT
ncbi:DUF11 domain-containing protein, partial [Bacillus sp. JEM-1]|uniref:DUF11 domain-containing protein n=1 Tax=Bacillus sp. JEM-1 TaxID=1977090 RepID=UPI001123833D